MRNLLVRIGKQPGVAIGLFLAFLTVLGGTAALVDTASAPSPFSRHPTIAPIGQLSRTMQPALAKIRASLTQTAVAVERHRAVEESRSAQARRLTSTSVQSQATPMILSLPAIPMPVGTPVVASDSFPEQSRVGIQVGHWYPEGHPEEAAHLRQSYGTGYGGVGEAQLTYAVAIHIRKLLEAEGVAVDLLPASISPSYIADAFVALHADGASPPDQHEQHGWKMTAPFLASPASEHLLRAVSSEYARGIDLPLDDQHISDAMLFYYAFNYYRYTHAIAPTTPAIIIEMGYMTHPADREVLFGQTDRIAHAIANGILRYLRERDPSDMAALQPQWSSYMQPTITTTLLLAGPDDDAPPLIKVTNTDLLLPVYQQGEWYRVFVYNSWKLGWIKIEQVTPASH